MEHYSLGLALFDFLPVLLSGIGLHLLANLGAGARVPARNLRGTPAKAEA